MNIANLRRLIAETLLLEREEEDRLGGEISAETDATRNSLDSVDDQIDSFLVKFEAESIVKKEDEDLLNLAEALRNQSLLALLVEQPAEEEEEAEEEVVEEPEADDPAGDEEAAGDEEEDEEPDPEGNEQLSGDEDIELPIPSINIDSFTRRVARLSKNFEVLLRVKNVILNRAERYLDKNYGKKHASEYRDILDNEYGFAFDEEDDEKVPRMRDSAPLAVGANSGGTGGLGGGGG